MKGPGVYRHPMRWLRRVDGVGDSGAERAVAWEPAGTLWCQVQRARAGNRLEDSGREDGTTHQLRTRARPGWRPEAGDRLLMHDGRTLTVQSVVDEHERGIEWIADCRESEGHRYELE